MTMQSTYLRVPVKRASVVWPAGRLLTREEQRDTEYVLRTIGLPRLPALVGDDPFETGRETRDDFLSFATVTIEEQTRYGVSPAVERKRNAYYAEVLAHDEASWWADRRSYDRHDDWRHTPCDDCGCAIQPERERHSFGLIYCPSCASVSCIACGAPNTEGLCAGCEDVISTEQAADWMNATLYPTRDEIAAWLEEAPAADDECGACVVVHRFTEGE